MLSEQRVSASGTPVIIVTLLLAALLELLALPETLDRLRPEWLCLVMIYWILALPHRIGVLWGFAIGLFQDALLGSVLGQHALAYSVVAWITVLAYKRLRVFPALQQSGVVFMLAGTAVLISYTVQNAAGRGVQSPVVALLPALTSVLLWRPVYLFLRQVRRRFLVR